MGFSVKTCRNLVQGQVLNRLKSLNPSNIIWISVLSSECLALLLVIPLNVMFRGGVTHDYIISTITVAFVVSAIVSSLLICFTEQLRNLERQAKDEIRELNLQLELKIDALGESERMARLTLDALSEQIAILDENGIVIETNSAWHDIAPLPDSFIRKDDNYLAACEAVHGDDAWDAIQLAEGIRSVIGGSKESFSLEYVRHTAGGKRWFLGHVTRFQAERHVRVVVAHKDITMLRQAEEKIQRLAYHDSLTGLPNRLLFNDRLQQALARADRNGRMVALLFFDLDNFKVINDTLGHASGDSLLRVVAGRLEERVRRSDTLARMGGDEFVVILNGPRSPEDVARAVRDIHQSLMRPFELEGQEVFVTASVGVAIYPVDGATAGDLLKNADIAMYHAKERGRNCCLFYRQEMNVKARERLALETALRRALENGEFVLHYQPWQDLVTGEISGMEALVRWNHPRKGTISPMKFIPVAEETGLIIPLGEWVLRTACRHLGELREAGYSSMRIAVNVSGRQLKHYDLAGMVAKVVEDTGIPSRCLELEITESSMMESADETLLTLHSLKKLGVGITVDDFGTGYSSLSYLKRFPVDKVKIDRSFVRDLPVNQEDVALTRAIVAMAHGLGLEVTAEGVETTEQREFLAGQSCDNAQGYHICRPMQLGEIITFLQRSASCRSLRPANMHDLKESSETGAPVQGL